MKFISTPIRPNTKLPTVSTHSFIPAMAGTLRDLMFLMSAMLTTAAIITLTVWLAGMEYSVFMGASTWGLGFIFLAMAMDRRGRLALLQAISGGTFLVLALLQNSVSPDFGIIAGVLVAAWVVAVLYDRLLLQVR